MFASSRGGAKKERIPPIRNYTIDLTVLDEREQKALNDVIERDVAVNQAVDQRVTELRREIQSIRKAGALRTGDKQNKMCARCKFSFWPVLMRPMPVLDTGARCMSCKFRICKKCRFKQVNNLWLCSLCLKQRQEKWLTGEWLSSGQCRGLIGSDLLRASLRDRDFFKAEQKAFDKKNGKGGKQEGGGFFQKVSRPSKPSMSTPNEPQSMPLSQPVPPVELESPMPPLPEQNDNHPLFESSNQSQEVFTNDGYGDIGFKKEKKYKFKKHMKGYKSSSKESEKVSEEQDANRNHKKKQFKKIYEHQSEKNKKDKLNVNYRKEVNKKKKNSFHTLISYNSTTLSNESEERQGRSPKRRWKNKHLHQDRSRSTERMKEREKELRNKEREKQLSQRSKDSKARHKSLHIETGQKKDEYRRLSSHHSGRSNQKRKNHIVINHNSSSNEYLNRNCNLENEASVKSAQKKKHSLIYSPSPHRSKNKQKKIDLLKSKLSSKPPKYLAREAGNPEENYNDSKSQPRLSKKHNENDHKRSKSKRKSSKMPIKTSKESFIGEKCLKSSLKKHDKSKDSDKSTYLENSRDTCKSPKETQRNNSHFDTNYNFTPKNAKKLKQAKIAEKKRKADEKRRREIQKKKKEKSKQEMKEYHQKKNKKGGFDFLKKFKERGREEPPEEHHDDHHDDDDDDHDDEQDEHDDDHDDDHDEHDDHHEDEHDEEEYREEDEYASMDDRKVASKAKPSTGGWFSGGDQGEPQGSYSTGSQTWQTHQGGWMGWLLPWMRCMCEYGREFG